jgi:ribosomal protein S19
MSRSIWKGPFRPNLPLQSNGPISILTRGGTITPDLINVQVKVHNGLMYSKPITISTSHIGRKFGSLFKTKKKGSYKLNSSKGGR